MLHAGHAEYSRSHFRGLMVSFLPETAVAFGLASILGQASGVHRGSNDLLTSPGTALALPWLLLLSSFCCRQSDRSLIDDAALCAPRITKSDFGR